MRGNAARQVEMLTAVTPDTLVPQQHPIRRIKPMVDKALGQLSPTFDRMYAANGRASIPPEHLLKACLLMALFSVRSERQFCERLEYDLLFKWFLDLNIMDSSFDHSVFAKNRQRLLDADVAREFLLEIVEQARGQRLLSEEHFSVDGTLLEAWASLKSFRPRDDDPPPPEGGGRHPEWIFGGSGAATRPTGPPRTPRPGWPGRVRARKRASALGPMCSWTTGKGLVVDVRLTPADGAVEREAALEMLASAPGRITVGADRGYDSRGFVQRCRNMLVTPHVAQKQRSAIDGRTTRHAGYRLSQRCQWRWEVGPLGRSKTVPLGVIGQHKCRH